MQKSVILKKHISSLFILVLVVLSTNTYSQTKPVFKDEQAQVIEAFNNPENWIQEDLWVETEFDTDGDGRLDRVHVAVTRPLQTETEGLKLLASI